MVIYSATSKQYFLSVYFCWILSNQICLVSKVLLSGWSVTTIGKTKLFDIFTFCKKSYIIQSDKKTCFFTVKFYMTSWHGFTSEVWQVCDNILGLCEFPYGFPWWQLVCLRSVFGSTRSNWWFVKGFFSNLWSQICWTLVCDKSLVLCQINDLLSSIIISHIT